MMWWLVARLLSISFVADRIVARAMRTPYVDIRSADGIDLYMKRWWLFNPYFETPGLRQFAWCPISIRVHQILRPDADRHMHDHPWNARTIVLMGGYVEVRDGGKQYVRVAGATAKLRYGEFHRIDEIEGRFGAVTLFITGRKRGTWGFKVPYREYLARRP